MWFPLNSCKSIRWAFNFTEWKPTREQWKLALRCVQKEEKERISRFAFVEDCKASMVGQLLMRKAASVTLRIPYDELVFARSESGKPFIVQECDVNFNISHHGDFCVLASEQDFTVGTDVMKIELRGRRPISDFFNLMRKQFSHFEWEFITCPGSEREQLQRFYRLWCLKESYVKATGTGIAYDLQSLSFSCSSITLEKNKITSDTKLYVSGKCDSKWKFEETTLDADHYVAVALTQNSQNLQNLENTNDQYQSAIFVFLTFEELMSDSIPFETVDKNYWQTFSSKSQKQREA